MTFLLLQAFLLMAAAYFLGAFLGCWWRRTFHQPAESRQHLADVVAVATPDGALPVGAINVPRTEPIPVQPRIEYVDTPEAIADRHRFERALLGTGMLEDEPQTQPGPAKAPEVHEHNEIPLRRPAAEPQPAAPAEKRAVPPSAATARVPEPAAANQTDDAVSAAAAAAAAAAAVVARHRSTAPPGRPIAEPAARPVIASGGKAVVSVDVSVPPLVPADGQDLKLVRGIDAAAERILNSLGVWRYADIARWGAGDVAAINNALHAPARIERENWIEQAAVLSKGVHTAYARRRLRGESVGAQPTETARPPSGPLATAWPPAPAAGAAPARRMHGSPIATGSSAAAVAAAAAAANRGRAASARPAAPARAPSPVITEIGASPAPPPEPAVPPRAPAPAKVPTPPAAPTVCAAPAAPPPAAAGAQPAKPVPAVGIARTDALQRIRGIDAATERLLKEHEIVRYEQIATWTATEVEYIDDALSERGRVSRENWIEQAQVLAQGGTTLFARQRDMRPAAGTAAAVAAAAASAAGIMARPSRLVDAMRQNQVRASDTPAPAEDAVTPRPTAAEEPGMPAAVTGLRSVRSQALRKEQFGGASGAIDDLKRIRGIGVLIEKKLNALGIASYEQIANWTADDIAHISDVLDFRGRIERENWVEQARILSAGGQTEFSRRVDRGEVT
jgi:predicted flap endonuclease-1-like 5' DNA nuclease